jgi:hypothetical protein
MNKSIIIIIILLLLYLYFSYFFKINENFLNYCDCNNFSYSPNQCLSCANCGLCINSNGQTRCVQGDVNGPLFEKDCIKYIPGGLGIPIRRPFKSRLRNIWNYSIPFDRTIKQKKLQRQIYLNNKLGSQRLFGRRFRPRYGERYDSRYDLYKTDEDDF